MDTRKRSSFPHGFGPHKYGWSRAASQDKHSGPTTHKQLLLREPVPEALNTPEASFSSEECLLMAKTLNITQMADKFWVCFSSQELKWHKPE